MVKYGHYTSPLGLINIGGNQVLWASNIKYLNDEHEFQHALDLIKDIMSNVKIDRGQDGYQVSRQYIAAIEEELSKLDEHTVDSIFTTSFTKELVLLSQWRGYCHDNNGFCIAMDLDKVYKSVSASYHDAHLLECVYDKSRKEEDLRNLLNSKYVDYSSSVNNVEKATVISDLVSDITLMASCYKHPSFSEEQEKRIVVLLKDSELSRVDFRQGTFSLIPYIELNVDRDHIKEVVIGPCSNKKLSKRSLQAFLHKQYSSVPWETGPVVRISETPYRS